MGDMQGQVALVTGGGRGIGRAICERLINRGVRIAAGYSRDSNAAEELQRKFPDAEVSVHQGNIGESEDCQRVVREVMDTYGQLDILVNNAGITVDKTVRKMTFDDWNRVVQVNLNGAFYMSSTALPIMLEQGGGRIINISSVIGEKGSIGQANYAAAKSGMFGLTMTLALETAMKGITVNAVAPGYIETDMFSDVPEKIRDAIVSQIPTGRLGKPDEVARVVEFLADPESGYITGSVFKVNGGVYMSA
ncbi:MAG TPA: 3-oxoacyl-ACP reductase family protein [Euzebyales bacterium]|nr:3-oxoacyl-ACP reductase family protein [Euzebyales bacterium]